MSFEVSFDRRPTQRVRVPKKGRRNNISGSTTAAAGAVAAGAALIPGGQIVAGVIGLGVAVDKLLTMNNLAMPPAQMWLCAYYQFYVLGQAGATSDHKANAIYYAPAVQWFSNFTGVPILDNTQFLALKGFNSTGGNQNLAVSTRVSNYLAQMKTFSQLKSGGTTYINAGTQVSVAIKAALAAPMQNLQLAALMCSNLPFTTEGGYAGQWAQLLGNQQLYVQNALNSGQVTLTAASAPQVAPAPSTPAMQTTSVPSNPLTSLMGSLGIAQTVATQDIPPQQSGTVSNVLQTAQNVLNGAEVAMGSPITSPLQAAPPAPNYGVLGMVAIGIVLLFLIFK